MSYEDDINELRRRYLEADRIYEAFRRKYGVDTPDELAADIGEGSADLAEWRRAYSELREVSEAAGPLVSQWR